MNNFYMSLCEACQHNEGIKKAGHYPCGKTECFDPPKFYHPDLDSEDNG